MLIIGHFELAAIMVGERIPAILPVSEIGDRLRLEVDAARRYAESSRSTATRRAYASDWSRFTAWCQERGADPLPADPRVVAVFVAAEADGGASPSTAQRRLAAIAYEHCRAGHPSPQARAGAEAIKEVMAGIRRSQATPPDRKRAADADVLRDLLRAVKGDDLRAVRDRAMLAIGMAGALRRSELVALHVEDLVREPRGLRIRIRSSKTDQEAAGAVIVIPNGRRIQPVRLLELWLERSGIKDGPLFTRVRSGQARPAALSDRAVARIVQRHAAAAGYDPNAFGGHSLRAGFLTAAAAGGASIFKMKEVSRHKSTDVLATYVRSAELYDEHAGDGFL